MNLIENWRLAWRFASVQLAGAAVAFGLLSPETQKAILAAIGLPETRVPAILGGLFILARLLKKPEGTQP